MSPIFSADTDKNYFLTKPAYPRKDYVTEQVVRSNSWEPRSFGHVLKDEFL